jgi:hypothetical protein
MEPFSSSLPSPLEGEGEGGEKFLTKFKEDENG